MELWQFVLLLHTLIETQVSTFVGDSSKCQERNFDHGSIVCVCNVESCHLLPSIQVPSGDEALVIRSSKAGLRWQQELLRFDHRENNKVLENENIVTLHLDRTQTYQRILGFGGAFTDAAGFNIYSLPETIKELLLRSYFSLDGLEYTTGRVPIGGTDFSVRLYTYDDLADGLSDEKLTSFRLAEEDLNYKIPLIVRAQEISGHPLKLIASAWSCPGWMKDSGSLYGKGKLLLQYYHTWAQYHVRFFEEYQKHNVTFWGLTSQNEPSDGLITDFNFNSLGWSAQDQATWIGDHLGPLLSRESLAHLKLLILDDNRFWLPHWVDVLMSNTSASQYVNGVAIHWYLDGITPNNILELMHKKHPQLFLLYTEACNGQWPWDLLKVVLGSWSRGQSYAANIIEDLQHWVVGWTDWNLALDLKGGPNWAKNYVDSPIIVDAASGEFYKQPMYYILAHFTKALPESSIRFAVKASPFTAKQISFVAFLRPDNATVFILLNKHNDDTEVQILDGDRSLKLHLDPFSISTIIWL